MWLTEYEALKLKKHFKLLLGSSPTPSPIAGRSSDSPLTEIIIVDDSY